MAVTITAATLAQRIGLDLPVGDAQSAALAAQLLAVAAAAGRRLCARIAPRSNAKRGRCSFCRVSRSVVTSGA